VLLDDGVAVGEHLQDRRDLEDKVGGLDTKRGALSFALGAPAVFKQGNETHEYTLLREEATEVVLGNGSAAGAEAAELEHSLNAVDSDAAESNVWPAGMALSAANLHGIVRVSARHQQAREDGQAAASNEHLQRDVARRKELFDQRPGLKSNCARDRRAAKLGDDWDQAGQ